MASNKRKFEDMTLVQLKTELRRCGGAISGRKRQLIDRLSFYENNAAAGSSNEPEKTMTTPALSTYKDLHSGMQKDFPPVSKRRIDDYLSLFEKTFEEKCRDFYNQRYIRNIRVSVSSTPPLFIKACVWAEMKKATSYQVDLTLDGDGVIMESQCECGAGMAPTAHCKHVVCVLYGLTKFVTTGSILTELTCTQVLQTFHHARPHHGSPMKTSQLSAARGKTEKTLSYDPRPSHLRNLTGYPAYVRNLVVNFQDSGHMPAQQLIPPANPYALYMDHDYLEMSQEEKFLKDHMISGITNEQAEKIERETQGQSSNKRWHEIRTFHITSSNFGTICKMGGNRSVVSLCENLLAPKQIKVAAVDHGRKYESVAISKYELMYDVAIQSCGIFVSLDKPFLAASPDGLQGDNIVIEVKCPYGARDQLITSVTVPYLIGTSDSLQLQKNHDYYYQIQGQLYCTGRSMAHLVVFTSKDMKMIKVPFDQTFVCEMIVKLKTFFYVHFRNALLKKHLYRNYYDYSFR